MGTYNKRGRNHSRNLPGGKNEISMKILASGQLEKKESDMLELKEASARDRIIRFFHLTKSSDPDKLIWTTAGLCPIFIGKGSFVALEEHLAGRGKQLLDDTDLRCRMCRNNFGDIHRGSKSHITKSQH